MKNRKKSAVMFAGLFLAIFMFSFLFTINSVFVAAQISCGADGLCAHYQAENNFDDSSGNGRHATPVGIVSFASGEIGQAFDLSGPGNGVIYEPSFPSTLLYSAGTMSTWVKFNSLPPFAEGFILTDMEGYKEIMVGTIATSTTQTLNCRVNTVNDVIDMGVTPTLGTWYHIAMTWDISTGETKCYLDGVLKGTFPDPGTYSNDQHRPFSMGAASFDPTFLSFNLDGYIDEARIYARALSASEIQGLAAGAVTLPAGIDSVTGTVSATGGTNLGDTITVSGGVSGGTVIVEDINKVNTADITVPANTMTTLKIFPDGMPTVTSTTASSFLPLEFKNLKAVSFSTRVVEPERRYTADAKIQPGEKVQVFRHADRPEITVRAHPTNIGVVLVLIFPAPSASASSDCDPTTCANLNGHCEGNWCKPNKKESVTLLLYPGQDVGFSSSVTPSAHTVPSFRTTSGLHEVKVSLGITDIVRLNMQPNGEFELFQDEARDVLAVIPNSQGIEYISSLTLTSPFKPFYSKVRRLELGKITVAAPANYKLDSNRDTVPDIEYNSKLENAFFSKLIGSGYDQLSATGANGINMVVISSAVNPDPLLTVAYKGVSQTKDLGKSQAINFIIQKDKFGNSVTVAGNSRVITGSLIEEISPAAIIEGWNYWYTATDNDYWQWSVILESLPTGCTADKTTASTTVANSVQTLAFNVDCGTTSTTTGAVVSGMAVTGADRGFATKGKATLLSEFSDCTKLLPNGQHKCAPTQQFREEAAQVVKGVMNPTGSAVLGLKGSNGLPILISLLTLAGVIALIAIQVRRKTVDW